MFLAKHFVVYTVDRFPGQPKGKTVDLEEYVLQELQAKPVSLTVSFQSALLHASKTHYLELSFPERAYGKDRCILATVTVPL